MKIFSYSPYDDVGGTGYRMASAFDQQGPEGWEYRAVRGAPSYLQFPAHDEWHWPSILRWWDEADVVHVHDHIPRPGLPRPTVVTFHGTGFRESPAGHLHLAKMSMARPLVSTLDLWLLAPDETTWCPQMDDLDALAALRVPQEGPLRIGHAPTNRLLKSTHELEAAVTQLQAEGADIELVMIEGLPWSEALALKGTCDVVFDQTAYGYGGNAIEAWAMGIPVICGAQPATLEEYLRRFGSLPFVLTDPGTVRAALEQLLDPVRRRIWGEIGRTHAERFHSYQVGVERLTPIYEAAAGR